MTYGTPATHPIPGSNKHELTPAARKLIDDRARRAAAALNGDRPDTTTPLFPDADAAPTAPAEKHVNITIDVAPDGLHIRAEYVGPIGSIPQAIERLKAMGVLDLVAASRVAPAVAAPVAPVQSDRADPRYNDAGEATCPVHRKVLLDGVRGPYCPAKAKEGQVADKKGYCGLKFND